ncbi:MAG: hypothetical protein ACLVKR_08770 [Lachnospiraceae bacterium]
MIGVINAKEKAYYDALSKVPEDAEIVGVESNIHKDGKVDCRGNDNRASRYLYKIGILAASEEDKIGEKDNTE